MHGSTPRLVRKIPELNPNTGVELLANEHNADPAFLGQIFDARPEVFAHNVETVPRIFKRIRPAFRYERSLNVLTQARDAGADHQVEPHPGDGRGAGKRSSRR